MKKTHSLKIRRCAAHLIDLNEYLTSLPESTVSYKIDVTDLNEIIFDRVQTSLRNKSSV